MATAQEFGLVMGLGVGAGIFYYKALLAAHPRLMSRRASSWSMQTYN
jgi:hypothetical protein